MAQIIQFPKRQNQIGPEVSFADAARIDTIEKRRLGKVLGLEPIILPRGQPRSGELWKRVKNGITRVYLVLDTTVYRDGSVGISWVARGELGAAGDVKDFTEDKTRIGWLGE